MRIKIKLGISSVFLIISLFAILWLFLKFVTIPFSDKIEVINNTEKTILITPYGRKMDSGNTLFSEMGLPTYYFFRPPSILSPLNHNFKIKPNDTKTLWFDINDTAYSIDYILIFGIQDQFRTTRVNYEYGKENKFIISDKTETIQATPEIIKLIDRDLEGLKNTLPDVIMLIGFFNLFIFFRLIKQLRAEKRAKKKLLQQQ